MTQRGYILNHLRTGAAISPRQALEDYGVMRLAARIMELREDGYHIDTEMHESFNKFGKVVRWARYRLTTTE